MARDVASLGDMTARGPIALAAVCILGCSTGSTSSSPNKTVGQCVLSNGVWYCGGAYGNYPQCPADVLEILASSTATSGSCDYDGGSCFQCLENAGTVCSCLAAACSMPSLEPSCASAKGDGGTFWQCVPSGTGCQ